MGERPLEQEDAVMSEPAVRGLPGWAAMLVGQVGYQVRLLTRTPRALWLAIFAPAGLLALRLGRISRFRLAAAVRPGSGPATCPLDGYPMPELGICPAIWVISLT
jgi:hypothetical protein